MLPRDISTPFSHAHLFVRTPLLNYSFFNRLTHFYTRPSLYLFARKYKISLHRLYLVWRWRLQDKVLKGSGASNFLHLLSKQPAVDSDEMWGFLERKSDSMFRNLWSTRDHLLYLLVAEEQDEQMDVVFCQLVSWVKQISALKLFPYLLLSKAPNTSSPVIWSEISFPN